MLPKMYKYGFPVVWISEGKSADQFGVYTVGVIVKALK